MSLIQNKFEKTLENKLKDAFSNKTNLDALIKDLDGGPDDGKVSKSNNFSEALANISNRLPDEIAALTDGTEADFATTSQKITSNEFANGVGAAISKWLSETMAPAISKILAEEITSYLKTASVQVTIPIGLVTQGASTAAVPNVAPLPITGDPLNPLTPGGIS